MTNLTSTSILLGTRDADRMRTFYEAAFGVHPHEGWLRIGSVDVLLDQRDDVQERVVEPGRVLISHETEDIRSLAERLERLGVPWVSALEERDDGLFAAFEDPDGNILQLTQLNAAYHARTSLGYTDSQGR